VMAAVNCGPRGSIPWSGPGAGMTISCRVAVEG
jgi:hypothetical protein